MATPTPQIPDKAAEAKAGASTATSVPELRDQVVTLAEAVERLETLVAKLISRS